MSAEIERLALAMWRAREDRFPRFVQRRTPDDLDRASGAWARMCAAARAVIEEAPERKNAPRP